VAKVLKKCRAYLKWIQNSVFEGEITPSNFHRLKKDLQRIIHSEEDSIIIYTFRSMLYSEREVIGIEKGHPDQFF
jgi:CRISPR-associated protein Cas2